jgi:hypothetical protein
MTAPLTELQIQRWKDFWKQANADSAWVDDQAHVDKTRQLVRKEILDLLDKFLHGTVSVEELRGTFDRKTRTDWEGFGLKGMSGAMFLNKLVKHIADVTSMEEAE